MPLEQQLPLPIRLRDDAVFSNFFPGEANQATYQAVQAAAQGTGERFVYLSGPVHSGRTHLLQAACHSVQEQGGTAIYLPFAEHETLTPAWLQDLSGFSLVCIDDVEAMTGKADWEEALFHLYNQLQAAASQLIISSNVPPAQLAIKLADLQSRLTAGLVLMLNPLPDEDKLAALQLRAKARGLYISPTVGAFLLRRVSRDMRALFAVLDTLDNASLAAKRKLTVPFVKEVLSL